MTDDALPEGAATDEEIAAEVKRLASYTDLSMAPRQVILNLRLIARISHDGERIAELLNHIRGHCALLTGKHEHTDNLIDCLGEVHQEITKLRAALEEFGEHDDLCPQQVAGDYFDKSKSCTCGFDGARGGSDE